MQPLTAMTSLAADVVARQFEYPDVPQVDHRDPVDGGGRAAWRGRAVLADALERAALAVAPRGHRPVARLP